MSTNTIVAAAKQVTEGLATLRKHFARMTDEARIEIATVLTKNEPGPRKPAPKPKAKSRPKPKTASKPKAPAPKPAAKPSPKPTPRGKAHKAAGDIGILADHSLPIIRNHKGTFTTQWLAEAMSIRLMKGVALVIKLQRLGKVEAVKGTEPQQWRLKG